MTYRVVAIDQTEYWSDEVKNMAGKIFTRYIYDDESATYCCEITPSRELNFLDFVADTYIEDEEARERLYDILMEAANDASPVDYYHVSYIDKKPYAVITADDFEDAVEYARGNQVMP
jgi:hypothetical protein